MIDPFFDPTDDIQSDEFDAITMDDMVNTDDGDENSIDYDDDNVDEKDDTNYYDDADEDE